MTFQSLPSVLYWQAKVEMVYLISLSWWNIGNIWAPATQKIPLKRSAALTGKPIKHKKIQTKFGYQLTKHFERSSEQTLAFEFVALADFVFSILSRIVNFIYYSPTAGRNATHASSFLPKIQLSLMSNLWWDITNMVEIWRRCSRKERLGVLPEKVISLSTLITMTFCPSPQ